ncbi:MAG: thioredoxin-disulfide reductase [Thermodesulfovibrionia bacterium]|nr:thioredoxin-disulfide reductase [Thermodesulfovibrionia bacterium]
MLYDVVIIGGGPAGLTAGLYTSRARLKSLLIEKGLPGGQVTTAEFIENYPGFDEGISGVELSQKMERQAKKFGLEVIQDNVLNISLDGKIKKVTLEYNKGGCEAKAIIIATGAHPRYVGVPGENEFRGKGVSYCAICDGAFFKDEKVAVVGGGDSAVEEAIFLTKFAEIVYIIHRRDRLRAAKIIQERAFSNPKIKITWNSVIKKIDGDNTVKALHIKNVITQEESVLDVQGVFIFVGYNPNTEFLKGLVDINKNNYIITDENMRTSVTGVFAAGDVRAKALKQIATAVGDGAIAAVSAEKYIEENF